MQDSAEIEESKAEVAVKAKKKSQSAAALRSPTKNPDAKHTSTSKGKVQQPLVVSSTSGDFNTKLQSKATKAAA